MSRALYWNKVKLSKGLHHWSDLAWNHFIRVESTYEKVARQAGAYPGFCSMKWLGVFLLPLGEMLVHRRVNPSIKCAGTHLYTCVERGTVRVKCLVDEHNTIPRPGLEPRSLRGERINHEATAPSLSSWAGDPSPWKPSSEQNTLLMDYLIYSWMLRGQEGANEVELKDTQSEQRAPAGTAQRL